MQIIKLENLWTMDYTLSVSACDEVAKASIGVPICHYHEALEDGKSYQISVCAQWDHNNMEYSGVYTWHENNHMVKTEFKNNGYFWDPDKGMICVPANRLFIMSEDK